MEGAPIIPPPESKSDKDSDKKEKKSERGKDVARVFASAERAAAKTEKQEKAKASLIEKLFSSEKPVDDHFDVPKPKAETASETAAAEASLVEDLAEGVKISHDDLSHVPEARDEAIVEKAVERAMEYRAVESEPDNQAELISEETEDVEELPPAEVEATELPLEALSEEDTEEEAVTTAGAASTVALTSRPVAPPAPAHGMGAGGGGGRPPTPPTPPTVSVSPTPPPQPRFPNPNAAPYFSPVSPNVYPAPATANVAPAVQDIDKKIEEAEGSAYRRGRGRGLVAGLVVGGGIEHIRHKRRERKMERKFETERKEQGKKIENMRWDSVREAESAKVREAAAEKYRNVERTSSAARPEVDRVAQVQPQAEVVRQRAEIQAEIEKKLVAERKENERVLSKAEQIEQERQREQLELAQGHHIESSAWHNIEVDSHGKAVQETTFEYGHEYYKERAHEAGPRTQQIKHHIDEAAGEVALVAAALGGGSVSSGGASQSTSHATTSHSSSAQMANTPQTQATEKSLLKTVTTPPATPTAVAAWFVVMLVLLAIMTMLIF